MNKPTTSLRGYEESALSSQQELEELGVILDHLPLMELLWLDRYGQYIQV